VIQEREVLAPNKLNAQIERTQDAPWGLFEGLSGSANKLEIRRQGGALERYPTGKVLDEKLVEGDAYVLYSGGGGGFGNPLDRPVEKVKEDVRQGYVSPESAKLDYGVVLDPETFDIDEEQTLETRSTMSDEGN
jgi:N-methylhydantoinase B